MDRRNVVRRNISAPRTASERHRRRQIRREADRPVSRRRIYHDPRRGHLFTISNGRFPASACAFRPCGPFRRNAVSRRISRHPARCRRQRKMPMSAKAFRSTTENRVRHRAQSASKQRVPAGIETPARSAICWADLPTIAAFRVRCGVNRTAATFSASAGDKKYPPWALNCSLTSASIGASTTTDCSEAQIVPLSKQVPVKMSETAFFYICRPFDKYRHVSRARRQTRACPTNKPHAPDQCRQLPESPPSFCASSTLRCPRSSMSSGNGSRHRADRLSVRLRT